MLCYRALQACRENVFGRKDSLKKSWDRFTCFLPHLSLWEINAPCWHMLMILPFLDWDTCESFRKEKAWLKSANWNKIFAYNRDLATAWAIHLFKITCSHTQFYRLCLICKIWCSHWWCLMICSLNFGNLVLSSTLLFQRGLSWGCKIHFESWWSFLYASQVLLKPVQRWGLLAHWMLHSGIDEEEHCLVGVNMVSCGF